MANSITLSQSLVDDIAQKLTDGTATAEQVVLYTKGLNQLQTGNDFQSVVIGLSQSAVDAIDSANAQFQEDAQAALNTFSQTSANINTGATNAISAMNIAKDTLIATDAEITSTINALPNINQITKVIDIQDKTDYVREGALKWEGPHPLPLQFTPGNPNYPSFYVDHPWKAPCFINHGRRGYTTHDGFVQLVDHEMNVIDEVGVDYSDILYTTTAQVNTNKGRMPHARWQYWGMVHEYGIMHETAAAALNNNCPAMTGYLDQNGTGRHVWNGNAYLGLREGSFLTSSNFTGANEGVVCGPNTISIVGTSHSDFTIARKQNSRHIYLCATKNSPYATYSRSKRPFRRNENDFWALNHGAEEFSNWGKFEDKNDLTAKYPGDTLFHDRLDFPDYNNSGGGLAGYNMNTNKFAYIQTEAGGTAYNWNIKLYTNNVNKKLRDIALGRVVVSAYDANPVQEGILTMQIDSVLDFKTASQATNTTTNYTTSDRYYGQLVLCDNDTVIVGNTYQESAAQVASVFRRMTKNAAGTEYEYDTQHYRAGNAIIPSEYGGMTVCTSNDGKYVMMYSSYYKYGSGIIGTLIRVADGAMLNWHQPDTTRSYSVIPIKADKFIMDFSYSSGDYHKRMFDADFLFSRHTDMTDITSFVFAIDDHQEFTYTQGIRGNMLNNTYRTTNMSGYTIYNPYKYLFHYYNADGTRKSIYDAQLNLI
jgi:hypothetical protein